MWSLVQRIRDSGTTVVLTTHYMEEAEALCDRVAVMFAPALVLILGALFGNDPDRQLGGRGFLQQSLPAIAMIAVVMVGVMVVPTEPSRCGPLGYCVGCGPPRFSPPPTCSPTSPCGW